MLRTAQWSAVAMLWALVATILPLPGVHIPIAWSQDSDIQPDAYEPDDTPEQAHPLLPVGIPQPRTFDSGTDVDWVYLDLDAGERVSVVTAGECDTFMTLYAPDGRTPLAQDDDSAGGGNAMIRFSAPAEGSFFVEVRQFGRTPTPCGPYQLVADIIPPPTPDAFEPDDTPSQAHPLPTDGTLQAHSIHTAGDIDWVTITVDANTAFRIATTGNCDTVLTLFGPDARTQISEDDDSGQNGNSVLVNTFAQAGTFYVRARAFNDTDVCDTYSLSALSVPPSFPDAFEPDDTPEQARPIPLDGTPQQRSMHSPSDLDWVSLFLHPGDRVLVWTSGPCDTYMFIVAPDGKTILEEDDDSGEEANAALFFAPKDGGLYYAVLRPFGGSTPTCPSYQLQALLLPQAQPGQPGAATPIPAVATAIPSPSPTPRPAFQTPTPIPTATPVPTPRVFR